jgi:poly-gamma-glutamate synthesis protein (capsule biosynthesis protein)
MFAQIRPIVGAADLALCHVEVPMGAGALSGYPRFNSPGSLATAIRWTGWDTCDTASNHTLDRGQFGIHATLDALDRAGVSHTGSARSSKEGQRILLVRAGPLTVAVLAYTYGTNGLPLPRSWSVNLIAERRILRDCRRARAAGAELVIVNLHWGDEYVHEPTAWQRGLARRLLGHHGPDVIVGQHVHVVQPIRTVLGRFVVYGEGNLVSNQTGACCPVESQDGLIALIRVRAAAGEPPRVTGVDYVPTWVRHPDYVVVPVGYTLARLGERAPRAQELRASYWRTVRYAGAGHGIRPQPSPYAIRQQR